MQVHRYQQHLLIIPTRLNPPSWMKRFTELIAEHSGVASCEQPYGFRSTSCNIIIFPKELFIQTAKYVVTKLQTSTAIFLPVEHKRRYF